jgi:hypothetical protein
LKAALDEMRARHGSIEGYAADGLRLAEPTVIALRAAFVERQRASGS